MFVEFTVSQTMEHSSAVTNMPSRRSVASLRESSQIMFPGT
jgi:hypothetical protein